MGEQTTTSLPRPTFASDDNAESHWACCRNEDVAICGLDLGGDAEDCEDDGDVSCVVCLDLDGWRCPLTGEWCPEAVGE